MKYDVSKIRELIRAKGMNEIDFLHSIGLSAWTLIRWEIGTEPQRDDFASYMASGLSVNVSDFYQSGSNKSAAPAPKRKLAETYSDVRYIPIKKISLKEMPYRKPSFAKIKQIVDYYKEHREMDKPVVVSAKDNGFLLEDKYLRYYVAQRLQLKGIPAIVVDAAVKQEKNTDKAKPKGEKTTPSPAISKMIVEPSSTIVTAKLRPIENKQTVDIYVVSDSHEQDTANGIFWVGRQLPSILLVALQANEKMVHYKGNSYELIDPVVYSSAEKYMNIVSRFLNAETPQTVYIFSQKTLKKDALNHCEMVTAMVPCANRKFPVPVSVYYDKAKKQYFLNEATYLQLRKSYGLPYLRIQTTQTGSTTNWSSALKSQSELNLLGYNVSAAEALSVDERRKILRDVIDSGVLWKSEVINHLEWLIKMGTKNPLMENAVGEWKQDLMYVSRYKSEDQRKIWVNKFKSRFCEKTIVQ